MMQQWRSPETRQFIDEQTTQFEEAGIIANWYAAKRASLETSTLGEAEQLPTIMAMRAQCDFYPMQRSIGEGQSSLDLYKVFLNGKILKESGVLVAMTVDGVTQYYGGFSSDQAELLARSAAAFEARGLLPVIDLTLSQA